LDQLDAYLGDGQQPLEQRRELWDILVALRGPDRRKDRKVLKHDVAAVIRARAFPRTAKALGKGTPGFRPTFNPDASLYEAATAMRERGGHYQTHAWRALLALARWG
jgi:hypothetical protein